MPLAEGGNLSWQHGIRIVSGEWTTSTDQEVRALCARVVAAQGAEFEGAIVALQAALRERFEGLSNLTVATILNMPKAKRTGDKKEAGNS